MILDKKLLFAKITETLTDLENDINALARRA
jgi:hypothetical protein